MPTNVQDNNVSRQGIRETGFPEPLSTLGFPSYRFNWYYKQGKEYGPPTQTAPNEELDTSIIADKLKSHNNRHIPPTTVAAGTIKHSMRNKPKKKC